MFTVLTTIYQPWSEFKCKLDTFNSHFAWMSAHIFRCVSVNTEYSAACFKWVVAFDKIKIFYSIFILHMFLWNVTISDISHTLPTLLIYTYNCSISHCIVRFCYIVLWDGKYDMRRNMMSEKITVKCTWCRLNVCICLTSWYALVVCNCILICIDRYHMLEQSIRSRSLQQ